MDVDTDRVDQAVLGLLYLTLRDHNRAWKGFDWDVLSRLHEAGLIEDPVNKAKSVVFTPLGLESAERAFKTLFGSVSQPPRTVRYGTRTASVTSADGVQGVLCRSAVDGKHFFRVYEEDGTYTDYDLRHDDLSVSIDSGAHAAFYQFETDYVLDHSPEVLGLKATGEQPD